MKFYNSFQIASIG